MFEFKAEEGNYYTEIKLVLLDSAEACFFLSYSSN